MSSTTLPVCPKTGSTSPSLTVHLCLHTAPGNRECARREFPPVPKLLDGEQEAHIIALRLGPPPKGYANWSLRLLARRVVELAIVESISHETIRRTLKKTG